MSLCVLFTRGSASAGELITSLESSGETVFAVAGDDTYARSFADLLGTAGKIVELDGDVRSDVARLRDAGVTGIATFSESGLLRGAVLAEELGLPFHSAGTTRALTDKHTQRTVLDRAGLDGVGHRLVTSLAGWEVAARELEFPLVLKPRSGEGSRNTHRVDDAATGADVVARLLTGGTAAPERELVAEEYLVGVASAPYGDYVSVESVCFDGTIHHVGVTGKFPLAWPFRETGQFCPAPFPDDQLERIEQLTAGALRALGVRQGVTHTEVKLTARGPRIIEVNGRLGGDIADLYARALGIDLVRVVADLALGRAPQRVGGRPERTHFQFTSQPPLAATRFVGVSGTRDVLVLDDIHDYKRFVRAGGELAADMSATTLDRLSGSAGSPEEMTRELDAYLGRLIYEFDTPQGPVLLDGAALRRHNAWPG